MGDSCSLCNPDKQLSRDKLSKTQDFERGKQERSPIEKKNRHKDNKSSRSRDNHLRNQREKIKGTIDINDTMENPIQNTKNRRNIQQSNSSQQWRSSCLHSSMLGQDEKFNHLIEKAFVAFNKNQYSLSASLFEKALERIQDEELQQVYSDQSLEYNRISILFQLIQLQILRKRRKQAEMYYKKCLKLFKAQPEYLFYQEQITLRNNYSLFLSEENRMQDALNLCHSALQLQEKYYIRSDTRHEATLTNLGFLYNKAGNFRQADKISQQIKNCRFQNTENI